MGDADEGPSRKRRRVSMSEALEKSIEFKSSLHAAEWAIEQFEAVSKNTKNPVAFQKRFPKTLDRVKNCITRLAQIKKKTKRPLPAGDLIQPALTDSMVDVLEGKVPEPQTSATTSQMGRPVQDLDEVGLRAQRYKLQPIIEKIKEAGQEFGQKTPTQVCGRVLQELNYTQNRNLGLIGKAIYDGTFQQEYEKKKKMGEAEALYMKTNELEITDLQYTNLRLRLLEFGLELPALNNLKDFEKAERYDFSPYLGGVRANFIDLAQTTLTQIFKLPEVQEETAELPETALPLEAEWYTGLDGSGGQHEMHHQQKASSHLPAEDQSTMPCISQQKRETVVAVLKVIRTATKKKVYEPKHIASVNSVRPYMLYPHQENRDLLKKFVPKMDDDKEAIESAPLQIPVPNREPIPVNNTVDLKLLDGKAVKEVSGLGGAYCLVGTCSKEDGHNLDMIKSGFEMNRTMEKVHEIFQKLYDAEIGSIKKSPKDQKTRQGVTNEPLTTQSVNLAPRPLHCMLRAYTFFQKLMYKIHAEAETAKNPDSTITEKAQMEISRKFLISAVNQATSIVMDTPTSKGGTTDTGNAAKEFFSHKLIPVLSDNFPADQVDNLLKLHRNLSVILRVLSSKRQVDFQRLKSTCTDTYVLLGNKFPTVSISETTHMVLGHSFQLIELNDGYGLGQMSEQGLEGLNKLVRRYSERFARQVSLNANITDVVNRLQVLSNPQLMRFKRKPRCTRCSVVGEHWTVSCPTKEKAPRCNTLTEQQKQDLNDEVESYLH